MAGIAGQPSIVTSGLVAYYDAANRKSYISGSKNWLDLTGTSVTGSLKSTLSFSSSYQGGIVYNGSTTYIDLKSADIITSTNAFTVDCWYNRVPASVASPVRLFGNAGSGYTGDYLAISTNGVSIGSSLSISTLIEPSSGLHCVSVTRNVNDVIMYRDGTSLLTGTISGKTGGNIQVGANFRIGSATNSSGGVGTLVFNGQMFILRIYNRALSSTEVLTNYNATRARFGL